MKQCAGTARCSISITGGGPIQTTIRQSQNTTNEFHNYVAFIRQQATTAVVESNVVCKEAARFRMFMKTKQFLVLICLQTAILFALPAAVKAQFLFTTNNGTITIAGYTGSGGTAAIPDTINGLPVKSIGPKAFFNCCTLERVTIPDGITTIGSHAFTLCSGLTGVTIPNSVTNIEGHAFSGCASLTKIVIPKGVTGIGDYAFAECYDLTNITIPSSVTRIGSHAFPLCCGLTSMTIPGNVTSIGDGAFYYCQNLANVFIPDSITTINHDAFCDCTGLTGLYFQGNAPMADSTVFAGDTKAIVYYQPGTSGWGATFDGLRTARQNASPAVSSTTHGTIGSLTMN